MFPSFTFCIICPANIKWMLIKLALVVVHMPMKDTHKHVQVQGGCLGYNAAVSQCHGKNTANIRKNHPITAISQKQLVDNGKWIFHPISGID